MGDAVIKDKTGIVEKTVLLRVNFRKMGNERKVSTKILPAQVAARLIKIHKQLLDSSELDAITKADGRMRQTLYNLSLPYDLGVMLLPRQLVDKAYDLMEAFKEERQGELLDSFINAYPSLIEAARAKCTALATELNVPFEYLWNSSDYPPADVVRGKFSFDWDFLSLAVPEELAEKSAATKALQVKIALVADEITTIMRQSLLDLVAHLKDALEPNSDGKPKRLFATAVTNIQDFLDTFKARNITDDTELESIASELGKLIHPNMNTDMLKKDESYKGSIHDGMAEIADKLSKMVEVIPGRKFRDAVPIEESFPDTVSDAVEV